MSGSSDKIQNRWKIKLILSNECFCLTKAIIEVNLVKEQKLPKLNLWSISLEAELFYLECAQTLLSNEFYNKYFLYFESNAMKEKRSWEK